MIEDPPLLTIESRKNKLSNEQISAMALVPTGFIVDAMNGQGALPFDIDALSPGILPAKLCGPALPCDPGAADVLATVAALSEISPGDILIVATGGWKGCAAVGDRVLGMALNAGAKGLVTDGLVRDLDGIEQVGLPVYCRGVSPNSPYNNGPGSVGMPVTLGDRRICNGDLVVADRDGVVIVPFERVDEVIEKTHHIAEVEQALDLKVSEGLTVPESMLELLATDQIKRI